MKKYKSEGMKKYKIEATLTYGMKFSAWFMALMTGIMLLSVTFIPLLVFYAMKTNDYRMLLAFLLPVLGILAWAYIAFLDRKQNREIKKWLEDAVPLTARATEIGRIENSATHVTRIKVALTFTFDGRRITLRSGEKNNIRENIFYTNIGYDAIFLKYVDRPIQILYSPRYDEAMILKGKKK